MPHNHADMIWRDEAVAAIRNVREEVLSQQAIDEVPLDLIADQILAEDIVADTDIPGQDHATMDGFAFDATDEYPLTIAGPEIYPEDNPPSLESDMAIEIATGASLPPEANAVVKREDVSIENGELHGPPLEPGTYTYQKGSNVSAGERLFEFGESLSPKDAIFLGDLGFETVDVYDRFSVGVLATGTEIHEGRQQDLDSRMLMGLVRSWGHEATYEGTVPDDYDQVEATIENLAQQYDVILTTGGTSVGHKDHVINALEELGEVIFHRVRVRPGKPIALARLYDAVAFAIPGKPIGAHAISTLVMRSFFIGEMALSTVDATLVRDVELGPDGFEYAVPATVNDEEAIPLGQADSDLQVYERVFDPSVLSSSTRASRADGFILTTTDLTEGETVEVIPYPVVE